MTMIFPGVWVRLAANKNAFTKTGCIEGIQRWRCFVDPDPTELQINDAKLVGHATESNFRATDLDNIDEARGLLAWLWVYGNAEISDGVLRVELLDPSEGPTL